MTLAAIQGKPLYVANEADLKTRRTDRPEAQKLVRFLSSALGVEVYTAVGLARNSICDMQMAKSAQRACESSLSYYSMGGYLLDDSGYEEFLKLYAAVYNKTRLPLLRGFTPEETGAVVTSEELRGKRPDPESVRRMQ